MQRKLSCIAAVLLLLHIGVAAQTKGLKLGNKFPEYTVPKMLWTDQVRLNISDFNDRLLIIDFWATSCSGCVAALPKMEALQKEFAGSVKILPVTYEPESLVVAFWKHNKYTKSLSLPTAVEDKQLQDYFPHEVIPHEVWIYKGKVIGITSESYVDADNINQVLNGEIPNWPLKDDYYTFDASKKPLFTPDENQVDIGHTKLEYVATCGYMEKNGANAAGPFGNAGTVRDSLRKTIRSYYVNRSILSLYFENWGKLVKARDLKKPSSFFAPNQILWDVLDVKKYMHQSAFTPQIETPYIEDWMRDHAICFESQYTDTGQTDKDVAEKNISDLNRLLGLKVGWEKRREKVLELISLPAMGVKKGARQRQSLSIAELLYHLNQQPENPYVFDKTGKNTETKLNLSITSWTDIPSIRMALRQNGFDLKEEEGSVDKFVFSEVGGGLVVDAKMIADAKEKRISQEQLPVPSESEGEKFLEENKKKPGVITLPSGLQYRVIKMGSGRKPTLQDKAVVHFTGTFVNGKIFESSMKGGIPYTFKLTDVLKGWTEALQLMPVGSEWEIYLPAGLAYGEIGSENIPPNMALVFRIELFKIIK